MDKKPDHHSEEYQAKERDEFRDLRRARADKLMRLLQQYGPYEFVKVGDLPNMIHGDYTISIAKANPLTFRLVTQLERSGTKKPSGQHNYTHRHYISLHPHLARVMEPQLCH